MQNGENDPLSSTLASTDALSVENRLFVAATVAAVVLAGSAIAYRHVATNHGSTKRFFWKDSRGFEEELENEKNDEGSIGPDTKIGLRTVSTSTTTYATGQEVEYNSSTNTSTSKSSRTKDRRKRGKDPLREVLKNGKKFKSFPNPAGSSSIPSSPTPPAAILGSSLVGKEKRVGENTDLYLSFEAGSSSAAAQLLDASPDSQRSPTKGIQHEQSLATPATPKSAPRHSRSVSQPSNFTHDEEDDLAGDEDADFPGTSRCRQCAHRRIQSQNSPSQSSLSLPRSLSSLADISEGEAEDGGWVTSVSKSRSKQRACLADVMFEDVRTGTGGLGRDVLGNLAEDDGMTKTKEKTRGNTQQGPEVTESQSNSTPVFRVEETSMIPPSNEAPIAFLSADLALHPSRPDKKDIASPANPGTRYMSSNDVLNADPGGNEPEKDRNQLRLQSKGSNGKGYTSFSSAVAGGGGEGEGGRTVIGQCQTVSVTAAVVSGMPFSGSFLTETADVSEARTSASTGAEDGEMEFTFPTLNSQATTSSSGPSNRARSTLIGTPVSSPSKKNKRFSSNKIITSPPNAPPFSPSNTTGDHTASQGPSTGGGGTPALSAQTQLASLRGALEAARLREEKHKTEMGKVAKELEMLKWESTNSRKGEVELQTQVRQLTHQLQSYAALFASVAPHLNSHFALQLPPRATGNSESSPQVDQDVELPNGGVDPSPSEHEKLGVTEAQEVEAVSSLDKAQNHILAPPPTQQPSQRPSSPASHVSDISSPVVAQHPISPPPSAAIPAFPYYLPQHPHYPVHHSPWIYHHYQPQQPTQNVSGTAGSTSPPLPPRHYTNVYSPTMYPISPVPPPLSPKSIGMMSPQLLHQYQPFGFGGGLRSTGASSAGSHSPELASPTSGLGTGLNKPRPKIKRRKSQIANLNGNAGWEDVGDGWIGLSKVVMQPTTSNVDKGRITDEGAMADGEGEDDNVESVSSPYSELLADAILKRSSTIRPSKKNGKKENDPLVIQEGVEEGEPFTEFTFPSLSDASTSYYRTASRTESSISSSLSSSPPSTTATVPDLIGDPGWEEDKASRPPVIEKLEDSDSFVSDAVPQGTRCDMMSNIVDEQATLKKEDHEQSLTNSSEQ